MARKRYVAGVPRSPLPRLNDKQTELELGRTHFLDDKHVVQLERPLPPPWWVYAEIDLAGDVARVVEVRVFPSVERSEGGPASALPRMGTWKRSKANLAEVPPGGIPRAVLEQVSVTKLLDQAIAEAQWVTRLLGPTATAGDLLVSATGRGKSDLYYARLAQHYAQLVASGVRYPRPRLAELYYGDMDREKAQAKVRDELRECRNRQLLGGGGKQHAGRAAGTLTERARRILADEQEADQ